MDEATVNRSQKNTKPNAWHIYGLGHKHEVVMMTPKLVLRLDSHGRCFRLIFGGVIMRHKFPYTADRTCQS